MPEELGRMEKRSVDSFGTGRKLFYVPLVFAPMDPPPDLADRVNNYWDQVNTHVLNLEAKLGSVSKIYHELVPVGGEDGAKAIEELNKGSYRVAKERLDRGAELQPLEDGETLAEFMDWSRCLSIGLQSQTAVSKVIQLYSDAQKRRNEHMAKQISDTLKDGEIGLLFMREGHQVQFPTDLQVFYVAPPALDELKRWVREHEAQAQKRPAEGESDQPE